MHTQISDARVGARGFQVPQSQREEPAWDLQLVRLLRPLGVSIILSYSEGKPSDRLLHSLDYMTASALPSWAYIFYAVIIIIEKKLQQVKLAQVFINSRTLRGVLNVCFHHNLWGHRRLLYTYMRGFVFGSFC